MRNNPLVCTHIGSNRQSPGGVEQVRVSSRAGQRARVGPVGLGGRLCVLGAGNDLHLDQVLTVTNFVDLVDLDGEAMTEALHRHDLQSDLRIRLHGCDVSEVLEACLAGPTNGVGRSTTTRCR